MKEGDFEKYRYGQVSLTPAEIEKVRAEAVAAGRDPNKAEAELRARMETATRRLQTAASEQVQKNLEKSLEEELAENEEGELEKAER